MVHVLSRVKNRFNRYKVYKLVAKQLKSQALKLHFRYGNRLVRHTKYYFSIVLIFKDESQYLKEWIEFHKLIGVDHIYAYNDGSSDDYLKILTPYIDAAFVTLIEWKKPHSQMEAYSDCFQRFRDETFWMSFIDIDEFICPYNNPSIKDWIRPYERYCSVVLFWRQFSTSGIMNYDSTKLVIERFNKASPSLRNIGKIVLNTAYQPVSMCHHCIECYSHFWGRTWTVPSITEDMKFIMEYADSLKIHVLKMSSRNTIQLNHYWSKSYEEYQQKMRKGDVTYVVDRFGRESKEMFLKFENMCTSEDYTITRFLPELRKKLGMFA